MRNTWIMFKREMMSYFYSPIGYIVAMCVLALTGFDFRFAVLRVMDGPGGYGVGEWFFGGLFTWFILILVPPILTMRVFADEEKTGMIESIMTTSIRDLEYVVAKFFGAYVFFILLWIPTASYIFLLRRFTHETSPLDIGGLIGGYLGIALMGLMLVAMGCMASALTRNQVIAAIISIALGLGMLIASISYFYVSSERVRAVLEHVSMLQHMFDSFSRGILVWQQVVFYVSTAAFFLFITHRLVQSRRWKN